jgi:hypothetical protein
MPDPNSSPWQQWTPLLGSLAAAYFSAIRSPRLGGLGGALGNAGAAGIGTYGQMLAQQQRQRMAELQAQNLQSQTGLNQAKLQDIADYNSWVGTLPPGQQKLAKAAGRGEYVPMYLARQRNKDIGTQLYALASDPSTPAPQRQVYRLGAMGAMNADTPLPPDYDLRVYQAAQKGDVDAVNLLLKQVQAKQAQARTGLYAAQAGAMPSAIARNQAEAAAANKRAASSPGGQWFRNRSTGVSRYFAPNEAVPNNWDPIAKPSPLEAEMHDLLGDATGAPAGGYGGGASAPAPMSKPPRSLWGKTVTGPDGRRWYIDSSGNPHPAS